MHTHTHIAQRTHFAISRWPLYNSHLVISMRCENTATNIHTHSHIDHNEYRSWNWTKAKPNDLGVELVGIFFSLTKSKRHTYEFCLKLNRRLVACVCCVLCVCVCWVGAPSSAQVNKIIGKQSPLAVVRPSRQMADQWWRWFVLHNKNTYLRCSSSEYILTTYYMYRKCDLYPRPVCPDR